MKKIAHIEDQPEYGEVVKRIIPAAFERCFHGQVQMILIPKMGAALETIRKEEPDVVLLDLSLFDSGLELTVEVGIPKLVETGIPVFILTGQEDNSELLRKRCFAKGAQDFMTKFKANKYPEELCERVYGCYLRAQYGR